MLNAPLVEVDPELMDIIEHEKNRQYKGLELIPSENFVSASVMEAVGSGERRCCRCRSFCCCRCGLLLLLPLLRGCRCRRSCTLLQIRLQQEEVG